MCGKELSEHEGDLVSTNESRVSKWSGPTNERTYLNSALSSVKPAASASTAAGVPIFRRANMARYRSKRGREASRRVCFRAAIASSEVSSGAALPESNFDEGGAGSMEV